jgi:hypothetical protein
VGPVAVAIVATLAGAGVTLALRGSSAGPRSGVTRAITGSAVAPATHLVWVPRGLPPAFVDRVVGLEKTGEVAVVAEGIVWLRRSWSESGAVVDRPSRGYRIPIDVAAVDPGALAPFLTTPDPVMIASLERGGAVLGATSARLRGLGPGASLAFGELRVPVVAVVPDEVVGAAEVMVSDEIGHVLGVREPRYLLVRASAGRVLTVPGLRAVLRPLLPPDLGIDRAVQIRAPGDTPFFRAGDAVLPPVLVKSIFGEFAARPAPGGRLRIDPAWVDANIVTTDLPVVGRVTCHRQMLPSLAGAMGDLERGGLRGLVRSMDGCFVARFIGRDPDNMLSLHAWGIAIDMNLRGNYRGQPPDQDPRLVAAMDRWGFSWGGAWIVPDGNHFEYRRPPIAIS